MTRTLFWIGFTVLGVGLAAPAAIADNRTSQSASREPLEPPTLDEPVPASPTSDASETAEFVTDLPVTDVSPGHWAYTAVENLFEVYGCLEGYPDGTFRGDEVVTRYEFAAAMDACLNNFFQLVEQERQVDLGEFFEELDVLEAELGTLAGEDDEEGDEL